MSHFDRPDDELRDEEYPDESWDNDDRPELIDCPECGAAVYEEAERCPDCGRWLTDADRSGARGAGPGRKAVWLIAVVLAALAILWWLILPS